MRWLCLRFPTLALPRSAPRVCGQTTLSALYTLPQRAIHLLMMPFYLIGLTTDCPAPCDDAFLILTLTLGAVPPERVIRKPGSPSEFCVYQLAAATSESNSPAVTPHELITLLPPETNPRAPDTQERTHPDASQAILSLIHISEPTRLRRISYAV